MIEKVGELTWKNKVKKKVYELVIKQINDSGKEGSKTKQFPNIQQIHPENYLLEMQPQDARLFFRVRSKMIKLRAVCHYLYEETSCRLCGKGEETIDHVLNECEFIECDNAIKTTDIYEQDVTIHKEVVQRVKKFFKLVDEKQCEESQQDSTEECDVICLPVH